MDTDIEAITQVVATLEHSQQNELPDEFASLFRHDAIWTTGGGQAADRPRRDLRVHAPGASRAMTDMTATYDVVHVLFIRPDVAAVKVRQRYLTLDGERIGNEGTPMYVMSKEGDHWLLTANQNTAVVD